VLVIFIIMAGMLLKKDDKAKRQVKEFSYDDYFMQSTKKDVERQKVYSIEDISRTVSGKYKEQEVVQREDKKAEEKDAKTSKKEGAKKRVAAKEEKKEEKPKEVRQFVVFVNSSDKDKERDKIKKTLGVTAGTTIEAEIKNEVKGEMPVVLRTTTNYIKDGEVIIPADSELFGEARFNRKTERVDIKFKAIIIAGGRSYPIKAMALDEKGQQPGIYAVVDKKFEGRAASKAAGDMLGKAAKMIPGTGGIGGLVGSGIESVTKEAGRDAKDFEKNQNVEFTVRAGEKVKVMFEEGF
ncbi:MAG: TrbI/VirB10 family protein, partial [Thermodesulfovibrionia bacterium]|nr:TrbI/VirB10 family protein [Thermodesulfovibrionia bacterium]